MAPKTTNVTNPLSSAATRHSIESDILHSTEQSIQEADAQACSGQETVPSTHTPPTQTCVPLRSCVNLVQKALCKLPKGHASGSKKRMNRRTLHKLLRKFDEIARLQAVAQRTNDARLSALWSQMVREREAQQSRFALALERMQTLTSLQTSNSATVTQSFGFVENIQTSLRSLLNSRPLHDNKPIDCISVPLVEWIAKTTTPM